MVIDIQVIRDWIKNEINDVSVDESTPDLYFFVGDNRKLPFATIVTQDYQYDNVSWLSRDGLFRLNLVTNREDFRKLFPLIQSKADLHNHPFDYQAQDTFFPHPLYGVMRWVSVINPNGNWPECKTLLSRAVESSKFRP